MRIQLHLMLVFAFCAMNTNEVNSQTSRAGKHSVPLVHYNDNINSPLTVEELLLITEVYGEKTKEYVLDRPHRVKDIKNILRNRVTYKLAEPGTVLKECQLLSEVPLFDDYVFNLLRDENFDPASFNPLKYKFNFHTKRAYIYKVDKRDYYIIINSQYQ